MFKDPVFLIFQLSHERKSIKEKIVEKAKPKLKHRERRKEKMPVKRMDTERRTNQG